MSHIASSLDWLRFTLDAGWLEGKNGRPTFIGGDTTDTKPVLSYNYGVKNEFHSIYWHTDHPEFRVMVEITGAQLSDMRRAGHDERELVRMAIGAGAKFTRIDFALDLFDTGGNPADFYECFKTSQVLTTAQTVNIVETTERERSAGVTVYIGSRQSERLVRVYDKGKQKKTKLDWIRAEIEVKGKRAMQFGNLIENEGVDTAGKSYIADVIEWSDIEWFEMAWRDGYEQVDIESIGRPETDREAWIRTVVIPVIASELENGSEWLREALEVILESTLEASKHGPRLAPRPD